MITIYICEECGNVHDGSYGSGRFCSKHCRMAFCGKKGNAGKGAPKGKGQLSQRSPYGTWRCKKCNLIFETRHQLEIHNHLEHPVIVPWNKGLTKETDERIAKQAKNYKDKLNSGEIQLSFLGKHHSEETKAKLALTGGKRPHSGRGKQGRYHGIWCDSSWELAWILYHEDHNIAFTRYHGYFEYVFKGKKHKYYPDFELADGTIVEIKGYKSEQWNAKLNQFPSDRKLLVLGKVEMKPYMDYVIQKYGKDFINLYERQSRKSSITGD